MPRPRPLLPARPAVATLGSSRAGRIALVLVLVLAVAGCKTPEVYRADADREALALVESRRAKLALGDGSFSIEPPAESLRQRILRGEITETQPLGLVECLEIAAENSRDYQRRKEDLYLSALDLTLERWRFGWQPEATADARIDGTGGEAEQAGGGTRLTIDRLLGNGMRIAGDIGLGFTRSLLSSDGWHPVSDFGGSITMPLLAGSSRAIVEEPLTQAERNLVYSVRTFERFRRTFAVDVATRYYRLVQQYDAVENQVRNYESLVLLRERNEELAKAGRLSDIDVGQARQDELSSKNSLLGARERLANQADDFKLFLGLPIETQLVFQEGALAGLGGGELEKVELDEARAAQFALEHRLDYLNTADQAGDSERKVKVAEDALRTGLTLVAAGRARSDDGQPFDYDFGESTWSLSAALDLPIDKLPQRNTYREALVAREAAVRAAEQSSDQIRNDLRELLRSVESRVSSYEIQKNAVELAQKRIESASLKLEAGRADTRSLLEAQRSLLDAQNSATSALVEYTLARMNLFRDLELLRVDVQGIHIEPADFRDP
ncbi:MAG: TolC family protein [Planctomycetes bacterium]|nr:TolC family protein [Planctomycetota bacterium]